ncbi:hypothetical protein [Ramlibacter sp.]|uniref:hypothetical protein n=1 Tax=Ramlibacter sp. TaxID=1917967 RepID=UPI002623751F|nr:hypothetical protein [Ramlibacter sp.]MDB5955528.1 hypothetical protein [Ramlibacter sp.]
MNSALQPRRPNLAHKRFVQPLWLAGLGWFIACAAFVAVAGASLPRAGWAGDIVTPAPMTRLSAAAGSTRTAGLAATEGLNPRLTARCRTCGIVETVRAFRAAGAAPAGYELTVRLHDGSRQISSQSDSARWRVGDSIMLIGGARLADRI